MSDERDMMLMSKRRASSEEIQKLGDLLEKYEIEELLGRFKPQALKIAFDAEWLDDGALAASFPRTDTSKPYFITLSPAILQHSFDDREAFSTIILHELGHILDRIQNWTRYASCGINNVEALEFEADDFVVACGWKDSLVKTLERTVSAAQTSGNSEGMMHKRLFRLHS